MCGHVVAVSVSPVEESGLIECGVGTKSVLINAIPLCQVHSNTSRVFVLSIE